MARRNHKLREKDWPYKVEVHDRSFDVDEGIAWAKTKEARGWYMDCSTSTSRKGPGGSRIPYHYYEFWFTDQKTAALFKLRFV